MTILYCIICFFIGAALGLLAGCLASAASMQPPIDTVVVKDQEDDSDYAVVIGEIDPMAVCDHKYSVEVVGNRYIQTCTLCGYVRYTG